MPGRPVTWAWPPSGCWPPWASSGSDPGGGGGVRRPPPGRRGPGAGSVARKLAGLVGLLERATPLEARYLLRTVTANLRLGIGTATILDALAEVHAGGRRQRPVLERAYNICSDLSMVAATLVGGGLEAVEAMRVRLGNPVRPMLAQRMSEPAEILAKLGGACAAEHKYDGIRVQAHRTADGRLELYTRRLERVSGQFPDAVRALEAGLGPSEAILEGEVVAVDPASGELRPFQDVMFRRRKYGIDEATKDVPVSLFCFELLYADGEDLTGLPYRERRARLAKAVTPSTRLQLAAASEAADEAHLETVFQQAVADGCEGLICKSLSPTAGYQAGARGWLWIKLKRDYRSELSDTLDLVVVGALAGRGRRAGMYGALLLAVYDPDTDRFQTVCKCGTGFSDAELAALPARLAHLARDEPHPGWTPSATPTSGSSPPWWSRSWPPSSPSPPPTPPPGGGSRRTPAWPCGSPASPAAGGTTRPPPTPPPWPSSWTCTGRPAGPELPGWRGDLVVAASPADHQSDRRRPRQHEQGLLHDGPNAVMKELKGSLTGSRD